MNLKLKTTLILILVLNTICMGGFVYDDLKPDTTNAYDLGTVALKWKDAFFAGDVSAVTFTGDGSALTGIGSGTGGVINTGSTTIGADSDDNGSGVIVLQIGGVTMLEITNAGNVNITNTITSGTWNGDAIDISDYTNLTAGTNITLSGDTLNVDDAFIINNGSDVMTGTLTSDGLTVTTTNSITVGTTQWDNGADKIEGNILADDSVDVDALDLISITLASFTADIPSTDLTDTANIMYKDDFDTFAELQTQIADKTLLNEEDAAIIDSAWTFSAGISGDVTGNASTATALETARSIGMAGDVNATGLAFDGTGNITLTTTYEPLSIVNGDVSGSAAISADKLANGGTNAIVTLAQESSWDVHLSSDGSDHTFIDQSVIIGSSPNFDSTTLSGPIAVFTNDSGYITSTASTENIQDVTGGMVSGNTESNIDVTYDDTLGKLNFVIDNPANLDVTGDLTGNADTATSLATGRTIGMTGDVVWTSPAFDGTANVTATGTIQPNSVTLGTDTTGNYLATLADDGSASMTVTGSGSETAAVTLLVNDDGHSHTNLSVSGFLVDDTDDTTTGKLTADGGFFANLASVGSAPGLALGSADTGFFATSGSVVGITLDGTARLTYVDTGNIWQMNFPSSMMTFASGSIKDSTGTISFDNENLSTTGTWNAIRSIGDISIESATAKLDLTDATVNFADGPIFKLSAKSAAATELGTAIFSGFNRNAGNEFFTIVGAGTSNSIFGGAVDADEYRRFTINAAGDMAWGSGAAALDVSIMRTNPSLLQFTVNDGFDTALRIHNPVAAAGTRATLLLSGNTSITSARGKAEIVGERTESGGKSALFFRTSTAVASAPADRVEVSDDGDLIVYNKLRVGDTTRPTDFLEIFGNTRIDAGNLYFIETSLPTAKTDYGTLWTNNVNELRFTDGDGADHLIHGDSFSNLWFHDVVVDTLTIGSANTFVAITSFDDLGEQDDSGNLVGSTSTDDMTVGANGGGEYKCTFHLSAGSGGAADEFVISAGQVLATPITITAATTATPIVCTAVGHGMRKGDMVTISGGTGMTAINGDWFLKPVTDDTFTLLDLEGNNSVGSGTYDASSSSVDIVYHGNILLHRKLAQGQLGTGGANADLRLFAGDKIRLYVANIGGTDDIDFTIVNMEAKRIGD